MSTLGEVTGADARTRCSRARRRDAARTGIFIGGKDAFAGARHARRGGARRCCKPFEISLFADPAGSFTTAAAMLAVVEKTLKDKITARSPASQIAIFGATGVVGTAAGVIAALEGAK